MSGPSDVPLDTMDSGGLGMMSVGSSVAVVTGEPGVLVALVRPGDTLEWSAGVTVGADGVPARVWDSTEVPDGALVAPIPPGTGSAVLYRVVRDGVVLEEATANDWSGAWEEVSAADVPAPLRPGRATADPSAFQAALLELTAGTGLTAADLRTSVLWAGTMPVLDGNRAQVVVVTAVLPNGALLTSTGYSWESATTGATGGCGTSGHPAGTDPATLVVASRCDVWSGDGDQQLSDLVVTAPPGIREVTLGAADDGPTVPVRLTRGHTVVREVDPGLTTVTAPIPGPVTVAWPGFFDV